MKSGGGPSVDGVVNISFSRGGDDSLLLTIEIKAENHCNRGNNSHDH